MAAREHNPVRIMEIVMHVIAQLKNADNVDDIDIDSLRIDGYTDSEISTAVSWLVERMEHSMLLQPASERLATKSTNFRILHPAERLLFDTDAHGELIQLQTLGLISTQHIEHIIERAVISSGATLNKESVQGIVAELLFREQPRQHGSRIVMHYDRHIH